MVTLTANPLWMPGIGSLVSTPPLSSEPPTSEPPTSEPPSTEPETITTEPPEPTSTEPPSTEPPEPTSTDDGPQIHPDWMNPPPIHAEWMQPPPSIPPAETVTSEPTSTPAGWAEVPSEWHASILLALVLIMAAMWAGLGRYWTSGRMGK